ncbi:hypothetical protein HF319_01295 [Xanthomonas sp. Kuri4-1]
MSRGTPFVEPGERKMSRADKGESNLRERAVAVLENSFLTGFQHSCSMMLWKLVSTSNGELTEWAVAGKKEIYVTVGFILPDASDASAWIYHDGCMVEARGQSYHFEAPDFRSMENLQGSFLETVASLLRGETPHSGGSGWVGLFRAGEL